MDDCRHRKQARRGAAWPFDCSIDGRNYSTTRMAERCRTCPLREATPNVAPRRPRSVWVGLARRGE